MQNSIKNKIQFFRNTIDSIQFGLNKNLDLNLLNIKDYNNSIEQLENIINYINNINQDNIINELQIINNKLSSIIKLYGVYNFDYLLKICFDNNIINLIHENINKYNLISNYLHPISYKVTYINNKNNDKKDKLSSSDKKYINDPQLLNCYDMEDNTNSFYIKVYGISVIIPDFKNNKILIINTIVDNILINNIDNNYIISKKLTCELLFDNYKSNELYDIQTSYNFINNLTLKDYLIYNEQELFDNYIMIKNNINLTLNKTINLIAQDFISKSLFYQRKMLIDLLINSTNNCEILYISYLLYDLLSCENSSLNDTTDQKIIYNSLPSYCKKLFKEAMTKTIEYTSELSNFDYDNKIPLEQQICLMKVNENVKKKAMQKLKEIKAKSEDSCSKARQYLDGLLKVPFGIYKEEYILSKRKEFKILFNSLIEPIKNINTNDINIHEIQDFILTTKDMLKDNYNISEIQNLCAIIETNLNPIYNNIINYILNDKNVCNKKNLTTILNLINTINKKYNKSLIKCKNSNNSVIINSIKDYIDNNIDTNITHDILNFLESITSKSIYSNIINMDRILIKMNNKQKEILDYIRSFNNILDNAVYGHKKAKMQIERILGQWISGENLGYCFGFEGAAGIGKTSLAKKGLANCLKDKNGISRPFAFIALGGSSNGSMLDGHNYTYVGSTWGKIVDILIEKNCMNPIIFIDELDKVSKTEYGKEIIGVLMHLTDSTQNDTFQDKYFSNIDFDLSKALIIFSYNDPELIDRILLDRIHRIKFDNLSLEDKIIVTKDYLLPDLYKKFGLENIISFEDNLIKYIIENYTNEAGVRKLKEILFEIISTINLDLLKKTKKYDLPIIITHNIISNILYERDFIKHLKINNIPKIAVVNGLWANSYGNSGILHIEAQYFYSNTIFELKLTGMQGDVMKESMTVAKTLSMSLLKEIEINKIIQKFEKTKMQGIHIHVPEGSTPKDGPSAGCAIALVIYSLLLNKKIKNTYALTGEINLQGDITAIGSLDLKILGGIKAGVKSFLFPKQNSKEFKIFFEKHQELLESFEFYEVSHISDVIKYMLI